MPFAVRDRCMTPPWAHTMTARSDSHHQAPARPSLGCRGHCLMSIKGPFLLASLASSLCLAIRLVTYVLMFWGEPAAGLLLLVMQQLERSPSFALLCRDRACFADAPNSCFMCVVAT